MKVQRATSCVFNAKFGAAQIPPPRPQSAVVALHKIKQASTFGEHTLCQGFDKRGLIAANRRTVQLVSMAYSCR